MNVSTLYKAGAAAFILSGLFNIVADFLPITATRLLNFGGVSVGILGLVAIYLFQREKVGVFGFISYVLAALGFIGIAGFLFVDAFVFPYVSTTLQEELVNGPTGTAIFISVIAYVLGVVLFNVASFRARRYPTPALVLWTVGVLPTLAATALPGFVITIAEITASIGIVWIGSIVWRNADQEVQG